MFEIGSWELGFDAMVDMKVVWRQECKRLIYCEDDDICLRESDISSCASSSQHSLPVARFESGKQDIRRLTILS